MLTVWEFESRGRLESNTRLDKLANEIRFIGDNKIQQDARRLRSKTELKKMKQEILRRQAQLEAEIDLLFPIPTRIKKASLEE